MQQATEGCLKFALLWIAAQTFGTPPAAFGVHLPYNVGEALSCCPLSAATAGSNARSAKLRLDAKKRASLTEHVRQ